MGARQGWIRKEDFGSFHGSKLSRSTTGLAAFESPGLRVVTCADAPSGFVVNLRKQSLEAFVVEAAKSLDDVSAREKLETFPQPIHLPIT